DRALGEGVHRDAGELERVGDARLLEGDVGNAAGDGFGTIERSGGRQLSDRYQILLVLCRDEAVWHGPEAEHGEHDQPGVDGERNRAVPHGQAERTGIVIAAAGEGAVEAGKE